MKRHGMTIAEALPVLAELIVAVGGLEVIRLTRETRKEFVLMCTDALMPDVDGRARSGVWEMVITTAYPHAFADRDRCLAAERQRKEDERRDRVRRRRVASQSRPRKKRVRAACSLCGSRDTLLSGAGSCVNESRCQRRRRVAS